MGLRDLFPRRSREERREDIKSSLAETGLYALIFCAGVALCLAGGYFGYNAIIGIGLLAAVFGLLSFVSSIFVLLADISIGRFVVTVLFALIVCAYGLLELYLFLTAT